MIGHSLGGALASMASAFAVDDGLVQHDDMSVYSFGCPRVGDKTFAENVEKVNR